MLSVGARLAGPADAARVLLPFAEGGRPELALALEEAEPPWLPVIKLTASQSAANALLTFAGRVLVLQTGATWDGFMLVRV